MLSQALAVDDDEGDASLDVQKRYTKGLLTPNQYHALEALMTRERGETMISVSERAGITSRTLYRYLELPHFQEAYRKRVKSELSANRVRVSNALLNAATQPPGMPGQVSAQKLYWQLIGDLKESIEVSGPDGNPIQVQTSPALLSRLSVDLKRRIVEELEEIRKEDERIAAERDKQEDRAEDRADDRTIDVTPEQQKALPPAIEETREKAEE